MGSARSKRSILLLLLLVERVGLNLTIPGDSEDYLTSFLQGACHIGAPLTESARGAETTFGLLPTTAPKGCT